MNSIINNLGFTLTIFVLIPMAFTIIFTYKFFCKSYGITVNKPLWKKIVESFLGIVFFLLLLIETIYYAYNINKAKPIIICTIISFVFGIIFIVFEHKKTNKDDDKEKNSHQNKKTVQEDKNSLIERLGNKKTIDYIREALSELSIGISICYFIITPVLVVINKIIAIDSIMLLHFFWEGIIAVISTLVLISHFHIIFISIRSNDNPAVDTGVDKVKKRLID
jgi:hypothetical protein